MRNINEAGHCFDGDIAIYVVAIYLCNLFEF